MATVPHSPEDGPMIFNSHAWLGLGGLAALPGLGSVPSDDLINFSHGLRPFSTFTLGSMRLFLGWGMRYGERSIVSTIARTWGTSTSGTPLDGAHVWSVV